MSKDAAMRAMREAKYRERAAGSSAPATSVSPAVRPPTRKPEPAATPAEPARPGPAGEELCGHRSMNGRTCTREQGHAARSHRYA